MNSKSTRLSTRLLLMALCAGILCAAPPKTDESMASLSLDAMPPAAAAAAGPAHQEDEYVAAFRADLADPHNPVFMGVLEARILADELDMGVEIYELDHSFSSSSCCQAIVEREVINAERLREDYAGRLLFKNRHFCVVNAAEPEEAQFMERTPGLPEYYREVGVRGAAGQPERMVPSDGNCLITALYFMAYKRFPTPHETTHYRNIIAASLSREAILQDVEQMHVDLVHNAAERPFENGRFATWGPRTSALFLADRAFMAAREGVLASQREYEERVLSPFSSASASSAARLTPMAASDMDEIDDQAELEAAIALSLSGNQEAEMEEEKHGN